MLPMAVPGLVLGLGCLFASFAKEFHQVLLSYGLVLGLGLGKTEHVHYIYILVNREICTYICYKYTYSK